jgi:uncharacterized protein (TIGR02594 family)
MARKPQVSSTQPYIKSDEIQLDTFKAPWMDFAYEELGKKVHEIAADDAFIGELRQQLSLRKALAEAEQQTLTLGTNSQLQGTAGGAFEPARYTLFGRGKAPTLGDPTQRLVGAMEAARLKESNPEIHKYFAGIKTDPAGDPKGRGRSWDVASTYENAGKGEVTPWCAAFVNWCLGQAGAPRLGYATARSWLEFGTPVAAPVYGCITVIKPSGETRSTTGHVAFFVEHVGDKVKLLGGNQVRGTRVSETLFAAGSVIGYRWPTKIDHYLLAGTGVRV